MRWMRRASILIFCAVSLAAPGEAFALTIAPPGKAGADQYFETIPSSAGNVAPPGGGTGGSGPAQAPLGQGRAGIAKLVRLGQDGRAAAAFAATSAPSPAHGAPAGGAARVPDGQGGSASGALARVLTGSDAGGLGLVLPLLLATSLIAAIGLAAARRRRQGGPPELSA